MRLRSIGLFAVLVLVIASCGSGSPEAGDSSDGIQVHGDWTIDVYNEDGSLDRHVEFSNAFSGNAPLVSLLTGASSGGLWTILVREALNPSALCPSTPAGCEVGNVMAEAVDSDANGHLDTVRLSGSTAVEADGSIEWVETRLGRCSSNIAPDDCTNDSDAIYTFTFKNFLDPGIPDPVAVVSGQDVQVEVEISFTSG